MIGEGWENAAGLLRSEIERLTEVIGELSIGVGQLTEAIKTLTEKVDKEKPK